MHIERGEWTVTRTNINYYGCARCRYCSVVDFGFNIRASRQVVGARRQYDDWPCFVLVFVVIKRIIRC